MADVCPRCGSGNIVRTTYTAYKDAECLECRHTWHHWVDVPTRGTSVPNEGEGETEVYCYDCNRPYGDGGFPDLVLPNDVWAAISPTGDEGGMLCPSCICKRLADRGFENVPAVFRSGPCCVTGEIE